MAFGSCVIVLSCVSVCAIAAIATAAQSTMAESAASSRSIVLVATSDFSVSRVWRSNVTLTELIVASMCIGRPVASCQCLSLRSP